MGNTTDEAHSVNAHTKPFDVMILLVICVSGVIGNILILGALRLEKVLRNNTTNAFICNLAICDFIITAYIIPFLLVNVIQERNVLEDVPIMCIINSLIVMTMCGLSIYTMAMIAVNRYMCICWHTRAKAVYTWRNTAIMIAILWIAVPLLPILPTIVGWGTHQFNTKTMYCLFDHLNIGHMIYLLVLGIYTPTTVAVVCYFKIYRKLRMVSKKVSSQTAETSKVAHRRRRENRVVLMLFISLMCFVTFWAPYGVAAVADIQGQTNKYILKYSAWLALSNSCLNTITYGALNKNFRSGYKKILFFWRSHESVDSDLSHSKDRTLQSMPPNNHNSHNAADK